MKNNFDKIDINATMAFDDKLMEKLGIPKIEPINNQKELWRFAYFDRHRECIELRRYLVSNYGRIYDLYNREMFKIQDHTLYKTSVGPYKFGTFHVGDTKTSPYLIHRVVAFTFIPQVQGKPFVNHIDGNPAHNYTWNLEWCNNSENYIHALKTGLKKEKYGEERSNAKWTDAEIHLVCSMMEKGHKATYIFQTLGDILKDPKVQYERVRTLYKHIRKQTHWKHISSQYNIDFSPYNYAKEKSSVENAKKKLNKVIMKSTGRIKTS